jgi:hypothetical protein
MNNELVEKLESELLYGRISPAPAPSVEEDWRARELRRAIQRLCAEALEAARLRHIIGSGQLTTPDEREEAG